jgi:hypothetical protein
MIGLRVQLEPLAELLDAGSDLATRPAPFLPDLSAVDALIARYLLPMASHYLNQLSDLGVPDPELAEQISTQLEVLAEFKDKRITNTTQIALAGIDISQRMTYLDVTVRPLLPEERGLMVDLEARSARMTLPSGSDFVPPQTFSFFSPNALLSVRTHRTTIHQLKEPSLPNKMLLALFLKGYKLSGTGSVASFDEPSWASFGTSHGWSLLSERHLAQDTSLSERQFHDVVDLARKIPDFRTPDIATG